MARGRKTGGRQKGTRNRATEEARVAAQATGILPLDYMLDVMRDPAADDKRRDAMAMAAAPYLHPKLSPTEKSDGPLASGRAGQPSSIQIRFVVPGRDDAQPCAKPSTDSQRAVDSLCTTGR
jgi:hypothetical protein